MPHRVGHRERRRWYWIYCKKFDWPWNLLIVGTSTISIVNLFRRNVFDCYKMKNMRIVIILRYRVCGDRPHGGKVFRDSKDRDVRSTCLHSLLGLKNSKSWNRLGLKYSRSGYLCQYSLRLLDAPGYLSYYCGFLRDGRSGDRIPVGGEISRTRSDRPWVPLSRLYNVYRVSFQGVKRPGLALTAHLHLVSRLKKY
jgi:hypothetical protein